MAKVLIGIGLVFVIIGVIWSVFPNAFNWIGRLPGDIRYESGSMKVYFPVVTMIVISLVLSVILNLFNR